MAVVSMRKTKSDKESNTSKNAEFQKNFRYFHRQYSKLIEKHPGNFVAICHRKVVAFDKDPVTLIERLEEKQVDLTVCMTGYVSPSKKEMLL